MKPHANFPWFLAALGAIACGSPDATPEATPSPVGALAMVNDVPITQDQLPPPVAAHAGTAAERARQALEAAIDEELAAQQARALGLEANPDFQAELRAKKAAVEAFERKGLADLYYLQATRDAGNVGDDEASAWFDANATHIRTQLHVWQILVRDETTIRALGAEIDAGTPFEQVAAHRFEGVPTGDTTPWDTGWLRWNQVPEPWREVVYDLEPGMTSHILMGPNKRYWLIKLIERKEDPTITFETEKDSIIAVLREQSSERAHKKADKELRANARITYLPPPAAPTVPAEE